MPERPSKDGDSKPKMNRAQSLRAGAINPDFTSEAQHKTVEPARFTTEEKPLVKPARPDAVWTPPLETKPKPKKKPRPYLKTYERPLNKPHRAIVSKQKSRLEGSSVPSHMLDDVLGARIEVTHVNEVKETCKAEVAGGQLWLPMNAVMWLDKGWKENMLDPQDTEVVNVEPEVANIDYKSAYTNMYQKPKPAERVPEEPADAAHRLPEQSKSSLQKAPKKVQMSEASKMVIELAVLSDKEEDVPIEEKEEVPPPPITTNDMIIDCCCCRSHNVRRARVEFWNAKSTDDLRTALKKMGIRESIQDFAENEALRSSLRSSAYYFRNFAEILLVAAIICLFVSASQFVSGSVSNTYAILGGVFSACGLAFYHLASLRQTEYENRTEEVNQYIAKYKLNVEPHMIIGRLEENVKDFSSLDRKTLLGMAARSQRYY